MSRLTDTVLELFYRGVARNEIAERTGVSKQQVSQVLLADVARVPKLVNRIAYLEEELRTAETEQRPQWARGLHPALYGLLTLLPPAGTVWPVTERERWLAALMYVIDVLYPAHEIIEVGVADDT